MNSNKKPTNEEIKKMAENVKELLKNCKSFTILNYSQLKNKKENRECKKQS
mgnify:CR=1 FL=1